MANLNRHGTANAPIKLEFSKISFAEGGKKPKQNPQIKEKTQQTLFRVSLISTSKHSHIPLVKQ